MKRWNRRDFLRAAGISGAASAMVPLMPTFGEAQAETTKRLLLITSPNGSNIPRWRPRHADGRLAASGSDLSGLTSEILEPLFERHREKLVLLDGLDMAACYQDDGTPFDTEAGNHHGTAVLFSGRYGGNPATRGELFEARDGYDPLYFHNGPSIDQVLAPVLQGTSEFASFQTSHSFTSHVRDEPRYVSSYGMSGERRPYFRGVREFHEQLFGGFESDGTVSNANIRRGARRARAVQALRGEFQRLRSVIPAADQVRLDQHVEGFAALEARMAAIQCNVPGEPPRTQPLQEAMDLHAGFIAQAFACDRTRVMTYELGRETLGGPHVKAFMESLPGWIPSETDHHGTSHDSRFDRDADHNIAVSQVHFSQRVAQILDLLSAPDDAGNSLMDDTVVVWAMPMSHGGVHSARGTVAVVAQGRNGPFEANRYHRYGRLDYEFVTTDNYPSVIDCGPRPDGYPRHNTALCGWEHGCAPNNQLLVSLLNAFGVEGDTFGDERFRGRLPGLDQFSGPWT